MSPPTTILVFGSTGLIGHEIAREFGALGTVVAPSHHEADLLSPESVRDLIRRVRPTIVINAAAYTMVDRAESEPELCARLNVDAPALVAEECRRLGAALVHFSTDYVFDGTKRTPYVESDEPNPQSVYGQTKLDGERAIVSVGGRYLIVRTSWIYGTRGHNFVLTMLRLARERAELAIVDDQIGAPTSASAAALGVAQVFRALFREADFGGAVESAAGVYHMTGPGSTTWYEFARRILADDPRSIEHLCRVVRPISTAEYPTQAQRPAYSVLDSSKLAERFGARLPPWTEQWRAVAEQLRLRARPALTHRFGLPILTLFTISLAGPMRAQTLPAARVPSVVKQGFATRFPGVRRVEWKLKSDSNYEAEFTSKGVDVAVKLDSTGHWLETESAIARSALPAAVRDTIRARFKNYSVIETQTLQRRGEHSVTYEVHLQNAKEVIKAQFDARGTIVSQSSKPAAK